MLEKLIEGWGKRQISKLIAGPLMVVGVGTEQIDTVVAVIIAIALWSVELALSKINLDRLKGKK